MYIQGTGNPRTHWAVEASMSFWTKEREVRVWDFKRESGQFTGRGETANM